MGGGSAGRRGDGARERERQLRRRTSANMQRESRQDESQRVPEAGQGIAAAIGDVSWTRCDALTVLSSQTAVS